MREACSSDDSSALQWEDLEQSSKGGKRTHAAEAEAAASTAEDDCDSCSDNRSGCIRRRRLVDGMRRRPDSSESDCIDVSSRPHTDGATADGMLDDSG